MAPRTPSEEQRRLRAAQRRLARQIRTGQLPPEVSQAGRAYHRELERMRAPVISQREMNVIAQVGNTAELTTVYGLTKKERREVWKHYAITQAYLNYDSPFAILQSENPYTKPYYTPKRLENMIRNYKGKMTGGINPVEFASDPDDIIRLAQAEDITFETMYPHVMAAAA
jgi:hypothetical protein